MIDPHLLYEDMRDLELFQGANPNLNLKIKYHKNQAFWQGSLTLNDKIYFFRIYYNNYYPLIPLSLFSYKDDKYNEKWIDKKWYGHVFPDQHLCPSGTL